MPTFKDCIELKVSEKKNQKIAKGQADRWKDSIKFGDGCSNRVMRSLQKDSDSLKAQRNMKEWEREAGLAPHLGRPENTC